MEMLDGTRGLRGSTSNGGRKTQAPGGKQEETAHGSTRQSRGRQAPGIRQQAAASSSSKAAAASSSRQQQHHGSSSKQQRATAAAWQRQQAAAGSQSRGPVASSARIASSLARGTGREETSAPASQKWTILPSIFSRPRAAASQYRADSPCDQFVTDGNAVTEIKYKTNPPNDSNYSKINQNAL